MIVIEYLHANTKRTLLTASKVEAFTWIQEYERQAISKVPKLTLTSISFLTVYSISSLLFVHMGTQSGFQNT